MLAIKSTVSAPGQRTGAAKESQVLNFIVIGDVRSGAGVVQSTLCNRGDVICHSNNLFHADDQVRRATHESYFGPGSDPDDLPEWFLAAETNPCQYIQHALFDNPRHGEQACGVHLGYADARRWELYDLFQERCREGDFCMVHVLRNPLHCLLSQRQAQRSGIWGQDYRSGTAQRVTHSVSIDRDELVAFCREHEAMRRRVAASCDDLLEVRYEDLVDDYQATMRKVFQFLELPASMAWAVPGTRKLLHRPLRQRVANFETLRREVPPDVRAYFA